MPDDASKIRKRGAAPPTARELLAVFFRQKRIILVSFCGSFLIVVSYGVLTRYYHSEMKVLVRKNRVDPLVTAMPSQPPLIDPQAVTDEEINSEVKLLQSEDILEKVVRETGLAAHGRRFWILPQESEAVQVARGVRRLARHLDVEPVRKTAIIAVTYASSDPVQAAKVLRCLASAYLERRQRLRRPSGESNFFEQQVNASAKALVNAEAQLTDFTASREVVAATIQRDLTLQKLSEAEGTQKQLTISIAETEERIRSLKNVLPSLPTTSVTQVRAADNPLLMQTMKEKLLELRVRRTELLTKFAPSYRLVREVEQEIADTEAAIAREEQNPVRDELTEQNPDHQWGNSELLKAEVELKGLRARAAAVDRVLAGYRASAFRLGRDSIKQDHLFRNLKAAEDKYILYAGKREEARIGDALDQQGILNVVIAEEPTVPALPAQSMWNFLLAAVIAATVFGFGIGITADYLDASFRTPDEVASYLAAPVLASLPREHRLSA